MSGERKDDRQVIERTTRDLIQGGMKPEVAEQKARESMRRVDDQLRREGKR